MTNREQDDLTAAQRKTIKRLRDLLQRLYDYSGPPPHKSYNDWVQVVTEVEAELKKHRQESEGGVEFGCHCDLGEGEKPDACVIDEGRPQDCDLAARYGSKEKCPYWRRIL